MGPLTRTVADAAIWLQAIAGYDPLDPTSSTLPVPDYPAELAKGLQGIRIGVDEAYLTDGVQPAVSAAYWRRLIACASWAGKLSQLLSRSRI